jgi:hypothetical protein
MEVCSTQAQKILESEEQLELSFVELVIAASECSEDESEIFELVDGLMQSGRVSLEERQERGEEEPDLLDAA